MPSQTQFDPDKGVLFTGEFTTVIVVDPAIPGHVPNLVIDPTKPFAVDVTWRLKGSDVPLYLAALAPANWSVTAYAESVGPGPEVILVEETEQRTNFSKPAADIFEWSHRLNVGPNVLEEENPGPAGPSGVYKIVVTAFLNSNLGSPGFDVMGFAEGPVIKVENPN